MRQYTANLAAVTCLLLSAQVFGAPPTAPGAPSGSVTGQQVTLQWSASRDDNRVAGYNVYLNELYLATVFDTTFTGFLDTSEVNVFYVIAFDEPLAGEPVAYSARSPEVTLAANSTTVSRVPDTQKPSRPRGLTAVSTSSSAVSIRWTPSTDNTRVAGYNVYRNGAFRTTVFSESFTDGNPLPQNINNYSVVAFDVARNFSETSEILSVQAVDAPPPVSPPVGPGTPPPAGADSQPPSAPGGLTLSSASAESIAFRWNPSSDNVGVVGYGIFRDGKYIASVRGSTSYVDRRVPTDKTDFVYSVSAYDEALNFSSRSSDLEVSIARNEPSDSDTTAPSRPTGLRLSSASTRSISFSWTPSTDNKGVAGYSIFRDGRFIATVRNATRFEDLKLPGTASRYTYTVSAYDAAFNFSERSTGLSVSVAETPPVTPQPPGEDVTAPSTPAGLRTLSANRSSIVFSWNASVDNVGVIGYSIFRDGRYIAAVRAGTRYEDSRLPATGSEFTYTVRAYDAKFNFSGVSAPLTVSTNPTPPDPTPPIVPQPPVSPGEMVPPLDPSNRFPSPDADDPFGSQLEIDPEVPVSGGPPTTPKNLRFDLVSNNWAEINWAPANDDVGVVAYNIYRSDGVTYTVARDQTDPNPGSQAEIDKYWATTSFIDCNFTRFDIRVHNCRANQPVPGETYVYRVSAVDADRQESPLSNPLSITYHQLSNAPVPIFDDFFKPTDDRFAQNNDLSETRFFLDEFDIVFRDEFRGTELDPTKWQTELLWGDSFIINGEQQYFVRTLKDPDFGYDPFSFDGEVLTISAIPTPDELRPNLPPVCDEEDPSGLERCLLLSGALSSHDRFGFLYGYVEGRMKVGGTPGMLSSFLLFHRYKGTGRNLNAPEIDILEYLGENPFGSEDAFQTYHFDDVTTGITRSSPTMSYSNPTGELYSEDYHTFGVLWEPQLVIWYIDGKEVQRLTGPMVSRRPMNVYAYLVTGSLWAPTPDIDNPDIFPLELKIDYLRVYQRDTYKSTATFGGG